MASSDAGFKADLLGLRDLGHHRTWIAEGRIAPAAPVNTCGMSTGGGRRNAGNGQYDADAPGLPTRMSMADERYRAPACAILRLHSMLPSLRRASA